MITIVNSGIANIASVVSAFNRINATVQVSSDPGVVRFARSLVLPGVGSFADGMESLRQHCLVAPLRDAAESGVPILGICLGMQLLADASEEFGEQQGLGLIPGRVVRLNPAGNTDRVPNIGWCDVSIRQGSRLFTCMSDRETFYFVHSYHLQCADLKNLAGSLSFGTGQVAAAVEKGNIFGVQFHPEKSQDSGLCILENFINFSTYA